MATPHVKFVLAGSLLVLLLLIGSGHGNTPGKPVSANSARSASDTTIPARSGILEQYFQITDQVNISIPIDEIHQGCSRADCIVSIDNPAFLPTAEVDYLADDALVLGLNFAGEVRAYPAIILSRHEVVNDQVGEEPVSVTYCPLCGSGLAFSRRTSSGLVTLGVSGLLHGSDLIMYDREGRSLWQQITGEAVSGPQRGNKLKSIPLVMTEWRNWRTAYPKGSVLDIEQGFGVDYQQDVYAGYRESERVMYGGRNDPRLNPKAVVYGFRLGSEALAVTEDFLIGKGIVQTRIGTSAIEIERGPDGAVQVRVDGQPGEEPPVRLFWFAWYTFNPTTRLITQD